MGQPSDNKSETKEKTPQELRDAHYFENGVTARHEVEGAQYVPKDGAELDEAEAARRELGREPGSEDEA